MNWSGWLLWGFLATIVLTTLSAGTEGLGLTRMNFPYILGYILHARPRPRQILRLLGACGRGSGVLADLRLDFSVARHCRLVARPADRALPWIFVLVVVMSLLPGLHPRMASEQHGPEAQNMLEPPGFMALHYGIQTPLAILLSHAVFGAILGAFYRLA